MTGKDGKERYLYEEKMKQWKENIIETKVLMSNS
jgi:hypothetical protein